MPQATASTIDLARRVLKAEAEAIECTGRALGPSFDEAVSMVVRCAESNGTVLVSGLGKSGLIGSKISATLASLGIPSHAVHPAEAAHGDLGRFRPTDLAVCLSHSGETAEVVSLAAILKQDRLPIISITRGDPADTDRELSSLERLATVALHIGSVTEAGGPDLSVPTASTTATLALGDALALAAAHRRNYTDADFAKRHPGGSLGGLLRPVVDLLRFRASDAPIVRTSTTVREALAQAEQSPRRPGALLAVDDAGRLAGIFTDSDLRRLVLADASALDRHVGDVMTASPRTLPDTALVRDAERMFREHRQDEIPVIDDAGKPVGLLDVQDLIALKLVRSDA
ncbi:MAG: KpsF/GutQ family sugar-phosphate isomerase [Planctomycetota bacterium]